MRGRLNLINHFRKLDKNILVENNVFIYGLENGNTFLIPVKNIDYIAFKEFKYNSKSDILDTTVYTKNGNIIHTVTAIDSDTLKNKEIQNLYKLYLDTRF